MLLAEALRERADAQRKLAALRDRIADAARYTEVRNLLRMRPRLWLRPRRWWTGWPS